MNKQSFSLLLLLLAGVASAQNFSLKLDNQVIPLVSQGDSIWVAQVHGITYYLMERSIVDSLTKKIEIKEAIIRRHLKVLAAQDSLLRKYEQYELAADTHISKQKEMLAVADSLHQGYKSLYRDLKKIVGISPLSFVTGIGMLTHPDDKLLVGSLGINYGRGEINALIGKDAWGVALGIRWPINF
ncbi:MAG: hypothetical protein EHM72_17840 [Calditrichaeota bacterium]|nr:MAG: hypothetical protein EHM72_17840 [Calditrichota bacterium]